MIAWTVASQALLSMEFSRQEYWSGLPFPSPGNLPDTGIEPMSLASTALGGRYLPAELLGKPWFLRRHQDLTRKDAQFALM